MALARAIVNLGTWPPPTIELHALLAALGEWASAEAEPATAFQHLNEITLSFSFDPVEGVAAATTAQKVVHHAMVKVYDGPITVSIDLGGPPRSRSIDLRSDLHADTSTREPRR